MPGKFVDDMEDDDETLEDDGLPTAPKVSKLRAAKSASAIPSSATIRQTPSPKIDSPVSRACSVCSASSSPMSTLKPCGHLICSSCLTGALNIVGEKDMRCATCEQPVDDFKLLTPLKIEIPKVVEQTDRKTPLSTTSLDKSEEETLKLLPSAFDELFIKENRLSVDDKQRSQVSVEELPTNKDIAVLRIDNVPWVGCYYVE